MAFPTASSLGIETVITGRQKGEASPTSECWDLGITSVKNSINHSIELWKQRDNAVNPSSFKGPNFKPKMVRKKAFISCQIRCRGRIITLPDGATEEICENDGDVLKLLEAWKGYFDALEKDADDIAKAIHKCSIDVSKPKDKVGAPPSKVYDSSQDIYVDVK